MTYINTPFYIGGYYRDRLQGYEVLEMNATGMTVKYDDGTKQKIGIESVKIKARIYENILAEYKFKHLSDTNDYFWTLGYLSMNGRFDAELPNKAVSSFLNQYKNLTGSQISTSHTGISSLGDVDKWGPELRIYFPVTDKKIDLGEGITIRDGQTPNIKRINNNSVWNKLVRIGFRLGTKHDLEKIEKTVPKDKQPIYEKGQKGI
jgi:hypothetical protein